jgi:fructose-1,6-bisphosphatase/inositol monophosphatase family enzyme
MIDPLPLLDPLLEIHNQVRDTIVAACESQELDDLARVRREEEGDTIYAIDTISEQMLIGLFEALARCHSFVLVAEGLQGGQVVFPKETSEDAAEWRIIVDPIDGTREIMYQKRSAWILTGVAPNRGKHTSLSDVILAIQTEIPVLKQHLSDQLWTVKGQQGNARRWNRLNGEHSPLHLRPSTSRSIAHGFAMISRFFPGVRDELAAIDDEVIMGALGPARPGKAHCFEDQYLSSGGQFYELMSGRDRFIADLRPLLGNVLAQRGLPMGLCCHPYDVCSALIATQLGVILTDPAGEPLNPPLTLDADVAWVGYANDEIRRQIEPLLQSALRKRRLL